MYMSDCRALSGGGSNPLHSSLNNRHYGFVSICIDINTWIGVPLMPSCLVRAVLNGMLIDLIGSNEQWHLRARMRQTAADIGMKRHSGSCPPVRLVSETSALESG